VTDVHTLAGAYALDAVNDIERAQFNRHLAECETCALEVAELREATGRLTDVTWSSPPPRMRRTVLETISQTPQVRAGRPDRAGGAGRWRRWAAAAVAASVLVVAAGAVSYLVQEQRVRDARDRAVAAETIVDVLRAPDASVHQEDPTIGGTVTVVESRERDAAVVMLSALPDPGADHAYELWLSADGNEFTSVGVLDPGLGTATRLVPGLGNANMVGVSREPAGGSPSGQPTEVVAGVTL
jgi:anti-sigma-K factor RskA